MAQHKGRYHPTGDLQGENVGPLHDKGTGTGCTGINEHTDGASLEQSATNRMGSIKGTSKSDAADPL